MFSFQNTLRYKFTKGCPKNFFFEIILISSVLAKNLVGRSNYLQRHGVIAAYYFIKVKTKNEILC
ncbi:hypothetical protein DBR40_01745 [Pedobacter sp. KBW01]|nr:hypothetical protein DBR40_01745 [Pedobacter sp. KBW01]